MAVPLRMHLCSSLHCHRRPEAAPAAARPRLFRKTIRCRPSPQGSYEGKQHPAAAEQQSRLRSERLGAHGICAVIATLMSTSLCFSPATAAEARLGGNPERIGETHLQPAPPKSAVSARLRQVERFKRSAEQAGRSLGQASEAAVEEMKMRAKLFDNAQQRTEELRERTSSYVDSMWQSLE